MFKLPKRVQQNKNKSYKIILNNKDIGILLKKIITIEEKIDSLIYTNKFLFRHGFFMRRQKGFNSLFMNYHVDLIFLNNNGKIIKTIKSFKTNTISKYYEEAHICIVIPENTIDYFGINEGSHINITNN